MSSASRQILDTIYIPTWFQGPTGSGQGGWTTRKLAEVIGQPVTVALKAPIPLDTELTVTRKGNTWELIDIAGGGDQVILEAETWDSNFVATEPLPVEEAMEARRRFPLPGDLHPVPYCFSCGLQHDSMNVHAGPVGDGRFATDWRVPEWAVRPDGSVDEGPLWAALDCTAAWYANCSGSLRRAFTVQYAAEVTASLQPDTSYSLVAWQGDGSPDWDGRKRGAASAAFDHEGRCVASARSFWVAVD